MNKEDYRLTVQCDGGAIQGRTMTYALFYIAAITGVNFGFVHAPLIHGWPPMSLAVGFVFVLRDFAQRDIGHRILIAMAIGCFLSWIMASPFVAIASATAFTLSELSEWAIYTWTGKPFSQRVALSVLGCAPIDSAVFLYLIGALSPWGVVAMTASKLAGALLLYQLLRRRAVV